MLRFRHLAQYGCALLAFSAGSSSVTSAESVVVTTVNGQTSTGELVDWNTDRVEISVDGKSLTFSPAELLQVRVENTATTSKRFTPSIELADESRLPITEFVMRDRVAEVTTPLSDKPLRIPADQIRIVQWIDSEAALPSQDATGDAIAVVKKDSTEPEVLTGIIGDVSAEQVEFTWEGDMIPVKRSKIGAISFFQKEAESPADPLCYLSLAPGARLAAKSLSLDNSALAITILSGVQVRVELAELIDADYSVGKLTYLSDMRPLKSKWTPLVEMPAAAESIRNFGAPRMNISYTGSPLTLSQPDKGATASSLQTYNKGIALRSRTEMEYRLPKGMRRFVATAGIDPETLSQGNVLLRIEADGDTIFEQSISGDSSPVEIDANIAGKQKLKFFVDYGENLDLGDRLHLVEARLVK
jgi:hypothetical protein